jgi:hypothetical protein
MTNSVQAIDFVKFLSQCHYAFVTDTRAKPPPPSQRALASVTETRAKPTPLSQRALASVTETQHSTASTVTETRVNTRASVKAVPLSMTLPNTQGSAKIIHGAPIQGQEYPQNFNQADGQYRR